MHTFRIQELVEGRSVEEVILLTAEAVHKETERIATLGDWPKTIDRHRTLCARIPMTGDRRALGFDAGIACALDLIPRDRQRLSAALHASFTPKDIALVQREVAEMASNADSETAWWLAACSVCVETGVTQPEFVRQLRDFISLAREPGTRVEAAAREYREMVESFSMERGYPYGEKDGCIQGAYLAGQTLGVQFVSETDTYYIGTVMPTLGLERFDWTEGIDASAATPGPILGSRQFVRCAGHVQFEKALAIARAKTLR